MQIDCSLETCAHCFAKVPDLGFQDWILILSCLPYKPRESYEYLLVKVRLLATPCIMSKLAVPYSSLLFCAQVLSSFALTEISSAMSHKF
jgi:hypothetical protein